MSNKANPAVRCRVAACHDAAAAGGEELLALCVRIMQFILKSKIDVKVY